MSAEDYARREIEARIYKDAIGQPEKGGWRLIRPLITERGFAVRVLRKRLGLPTPLNTEDRRVLEKIIFPHYCADSSVKRVLFVGCGTYTAHYERQFFRNVDYWTLEPNPECARFGAEQHVISPLEGLRQHFPEDFFDLIVCNGVIGWGLDTLEACEAALSQCYSCLADRGHLLLGWDDIPERVPVSLEKIPALNLFRKYLFPPLGTWRYLTDTPYRHTYDFYRKPRRTNQ